MHRFFFLRCNEEAERAAWCERIMHRMYISGTRSDRGEKENHYVDEQSSTRVKAFGQIFLHYLNNDQKKDVLGNLYVIYVVGLFTVLICR